MSNFTKPGGGNKMQPYVPAGNGEKSGEYTNKNNIQFCQKKGIINCYIRNERFAYNYYKSKLVGIVTSTLIADNGTSISKFGNPNSVIKKIINGYIVTERYYNSIGEVYLDIDYTCHGNPKRHPYVPHIHKWYKSSSGEIKRGDWEVFQ